MICSFFGGARFSHIFVWSEMTPRAVISEVSTAVTSGFLTAFWFAATWHFLQPQGGKRTTASRTICIITKILRVFLVIIIIITLNRPNAALSDYEWGLGTEGERTRLFGLMEGRSLTQFFF